MSDFTAKRIILFSDGTGNTMTKNRGSNVWKLYEAIDLSQSNDSMKQVVFYDDGVGTDKFKPLQILGGAFGIGLKENLLQLYIDLCRTYDHQEDKHDEIFMFGFSRGAYTVRTLAGFVHSCGIIKNAKSMTNEDLHKIARLAYSTFRSQFRRASIIRPKGNQKAEKKCQDFKEEHCIDRNIPIKFIGVWDTVEAVGLPFAEITSLWNQLIYPFKFPDLKLNDSVEKACHALAIDDERKTFHPVVWDQSSDQDKDRIEQLWFPGMHSNVGGGYSRHGISLIALNWMMEKAEVSGLRYKAASELEYLQSANVHDKMHNSRAGMGILYRYKPRDIKNICFTNNVVAELHSSVYERILQSTGSYAPGNVSPDINTIAPPINKAVWLVKLRIWTHVIFTFMCGYLVYKYYTIKCEKSSLSEHCGDLCVPEWLYDFTEKVFSYIPFGKSLHQNLLHYYYHNATSLVLVLSGFILLYLCNKLIQYYQRRYYNKFWYAYKMEGRLEAELEADTILANNEIKS